MKPALIAVNARRHYAAGVPVWNPSLGAYYVLSFIRGTPKFLLPTLSTWARIEARGKRSKSPKAPRVSYAQSYQLARMGLSH